MTDFPDPEAAKRMAEFDMMPYAWWQLGREFYGRIATILDIEND